MNKDTLSNVVSGGGILAFLADAQVVLTTLVLVTALVLNIKNIMSKMKKPDKMADN
jgi:hypothetical protein